MQGVSRREGGHHVGRMLHFFQPGEMMKIAFIVVDKRNNVVVLFGTFKVQSFILTKGSDCGLPIVIISYTFLKRNDMLTGEKVVSPDHQNPQPSIYIDKCTVYTYMA